MNRTEWLGDQRGARVTRREFVAAAVSGVALPLIVGCGSGGDPRRDGKLVVGVSDALCKKTASDCVGAYAERTYDGLRRLAADKAGIDLDLRYFGLDDALVDAARGGELDAVAAKAWTVLRAERAAGVRYERLADVAGAGGRRTLSGLFIVKADSPVRTLDDLRRGTLAISSAAAYESSFAAMRALERAGVRPMRVAERGPCLNVAASVWEGEFDAGVVSDYCARHSGLQLVGDPGAFREIGSTAGIPFVTIAVSTRVPADLRRRLAAFLSTVTGDAAPADLHSGGLVAPLVWKPEEIRKV